MSYPGPVARTLRRTRRMTKIALPPGDHSAPSKHWGWPSMDSSVPTHRKGTKRGPEDPVPDCPLYVVGTRDPLIEEMFLNPFAIAWHECLYRKSLCNRDLGRCWVPAVVISVCSFYSLLLYRAGQRNRHKSPPLCPEMEFPAQEGSES